MPCRSQGCHVGLRDGSEILKGTSCNASNVLRGVVQGLCNTGDNWRGSPAAIGEQSQAGHPKRFGLILEAGRHSSNFVGTQSVKPGRMMEELLGRRHAHMDIRVAEKLQVDGSDIVRHGTQVELCTCAALFCRAAPHGC